MGSMRDYVIALTITIVVCIGLAITIPMLCFCICMLRFCYVARKQNKPEKVKCSEETSRVILSASARLPNSVNKAKSKSGTSQHFVTDRICPEVDDRLRNYVRRENCLGVSSVITLKIDLQVQSLTSE
ncbi:hypothetical protein WUBG_00042 [Wuchereria bancrofti]|uniref:Uncharacterized protein n=1 Tax=Wuchereria bancrofti TaxID=6293 RepID=J9FNV9_WUCBA|nr:hypothetical protein WUBG_00042 [Wuchereria bancrofti]VDM13737.1 unnamed protein product [Wuchereria bancrofti]